MVQIYITVIWHEHHGISSHWQLSCLFNSLFKQTTVLLTLYEGKSCGQYQANMANDFLLLITELKWPNSQISECTCSISHNAPFRTEMCTYLFWMEYCGIWYTCILGFVKLHSTSVLSFYIDVVLTHSIGLFWDGMMQSLWGLLQGVRCKTTSCFKYYFKCIFV